MANESKPCPWCKDVDFKKKFPDWSIIDDDFAQYVPLKFINYCFKCGRKLREK